MIESTHLDELLGKLADGDRSVFADVFKRLWEPSLKLCTRLMGEEASGADAAQSAMLRILQRASEYDRTRPALPWAMAIATFECRSLMKKRSRLRETSEVVSASDEGSGADEQVQKVLLTSAVAALGTLSALDQQTLTETYWETAAEAAGATLRKRRERALHRLRNAFRRLYGLD